MFSTRPALKTTPPVTYGSVLFIRTDLLPGIETFKPAGPKQSHKLGAEKYPLK